MEVLRFIKLEIEYSIYTFINRKDKKLKGVYMGSDLIIAVYVDDILIIKKIKQLYRILKTLFERNSTLRT